MKHTHYKYQKKHPAQEYFLDKVAPFIIIGISLVAAIALFMLLFYLFIWGIFIGFILWAIVTLKQKFFPSENPSVILHNEEEPHPHHSKREKHGRVIDMESETHAEKEKKHGKN